MNRRLNFILYNLIIFILFLNRYLGLHKIEEYQILCKLSFGVCFVIYILKNYKTMKKKELNLVGISLFLAIVFREYYICALIIILSKNISKENRLKILLFWSIVFFCGNVLLDRFNFLEIATYTKRKYGDKVISRYLLGFTNPNMPFMMVLPILFIIYYISDTKKFLSKLKVGILILISSYVIFRLTYSRTGFILSLIFTILILLKDKYIKKIKFFIQSEIIVFTLITILYSEKLKNTIFNQILSTRPYLYDYYLKNIPVSFFSWKGEEVIITGLPLDSEYLRLLFGYGIFGLMLGVIIILYIFKILFEKNDYKAVRILMIILIYGYMEGTVLNVGINILYFIIFEYVIDKYRGRVV